MNGKSYFPVVIEERRGDYFESCLGWELKSILSRDLLASMLGKNSLPFAGDSEENLFSCLFQNRLAFFQAFCRFPDNLALELNLTVLPDLEYHLRGRIRYSLILRCRSENKADGEGLLLQYFPVIQGLLNSCFSEAEFYPVFEAETLSHLVKPFTPQQASALKRVTQHITLAKPKVKIPIDFFHPPTPPVVSPPVIDYTVPL